MRSNHRVFFFKKVHPALYVTHNCGSQTKSDSTALTPGHEIEDISILCILQSSVNLLSLFTATKTHKMVDPEKVDGFSNQQRKKQVRLAEARLLEKRSCAQNELIRKIWMYFSLGTDFPPFSFGYAGSKKKRRFPPPRFVVFWPFIGFLQRFFFRQRVLYSSLLRASHRFSPLQSPSVSTSMTEHVWWSSRQNFLFKICFFIRLSM